jgi:hypothetical protein
MRRRNARTQEHVQHGLRDRYESGQHLSRSHQRAMPVLHLVLLVPSPGVETTVRAAIAQPRRSSIAVTLFLRNQQ